jgi:hypothetical protein
MLSTASQRQAYSNASNKHEGRSPKAPKASAAGVERHDGLRAARRAGLSDDSLQGKRRKPNRPMGDPKSCEPSEADALACFLSPTKADQEVTRKAAQAKATRPEWWAAMVRAVFGAKTEKAQALIMPQACALQARTIGIKKDGKAWLTSDGSFYL